MSPYYPPGGGGGSSNSAGLAGTGPFYLLHTSANATLPFSKIISGGANITITTDAAAVFITATTGGGSGTPGGSDSQIQVNSQGAFAGFPNLRWIGSSNEINLNSAGRIRKGGVAEVDGSQPAGVTGLIWLDTSSNFTDSFASINTSVFATTGFYYIVGSSATGLPFSKVISAGSSVTTHTDSTRFYINATTGASASSAGLMGTGSFLITWSSDPLISNEKILTAGTSVSIRTDSTTITIDSPNKDFNYWYTTRANTGIFVANRERLYIAGQANALAMSANVIPINSAHCVPFITTRDLVIDSMGFTGTIAGSATCLAQIGIYSNSADNVLYPFQAISTSGLIVSGTDIIYVGFNPNITLTNNTLYWFAYMQTRSAQTIRTIAVGGAWPIFGIATDMGTAPGTYIQVPMTGLTSSGLPASFATGGAIATTNPPALAVRILR